MSRRVASDQSGFTIVEVLVAAFVLLVGILGVVSLVDRATANTTATKAREQAVALQREIIDAARSVPYDQLAPQSIVPRVQSVHGLADSSTGPTGWTIRRRGVTYTVALGACSVDDRSDGYGSHDAATFCATGTGTTTPAQCRGALARTGDIRGNGTLNVAAVGDCGVDLNLDGQVDNLTEQEVGTCVSPCSTGSEDGAPDDYKRIVVLVVWDRGTGDRFALQAETILNPGMASAPSVTALSANPASSTASPIVTVPSNPPKVDFTATTTGKVAAVSWYIDGTPQSPAAVNTPAGSDSWTFSWALGSVDMAQGVQPPLRGEVLDGTYVISAKALDRFGQFGTPRATTVVLNRRQPYAPTNFTGGRNLRRGTVEFEWTPNRERDVRGYYVERQDGTTWVRVCDTNQTTCQDSTPPSGSPLHYRIVALDTENGVLRPGDASTKDVLDTTTTPGPPSGLISRGLDANGNLQLEWTASSDPVDFYRIYRDGQQIADRYDRTSGTRYLDTSPSGTHTYWVTAVNSQFTESNFSNPITVTSP